MDNSPNIIIKTGFLTVSHNILFQPETMAKGKALVSAQHVRDVEELRTNGQSYVIHARVIRQTSVTQTPYKTSLNINAARVVTNGNCDCVYNQSGKCKHIAALIDYVNHEESLSKTSHGQQWGKPSARQFAKDKYSKGKNFEEMFPPKKRRTCEPQPLDLVELVEESALKSVMLASQVNDRSVVEDVVKTVIKQVEINLAKEDCKGCLNRFFIFQKGFEVYRSDNKLDEYIQEFYNENIVMSDENIINLCCETIEQSLCQDWYAARRLRISASTNVHNIKVRKRKSIESLVSSILHPKKIDCKATRYGLRNERHALEEYKKLNDCQVKRVGVIVSEHQPWLCASIDGVVIEDGCVTRLVEFKCPISCNKQPVIDCTVKSSNVKYLKYVNDELELKKSHSYYTQVQVQMYITGMNICDLFIYSPIKNGSCTVRVKRDETFLKEVILCSEKFYFEYYLPSLYKAI